MIKVWQADGIFQVATNPDQDRKTWDAIKASRRFFAQPLESKARHVSDLTSSGYIAQRSMRVFMDEFGSVGEKLLRLVALGLGLSDIDALTKLSRTVGITCECCGSPPVPSTPRVASAPTPTTGCW